MAPGGPDASAPVAGRVGPAGGGVAGRAFLRLGILGSAQERMQAVGGVVEGCGTH